MSETYYSYATQGVHFLDIRYYSRFCTAQEINKESLKKVLIQMKNKLKVQNSNKSKNQIKNYPCETWDKKTGDIFIIRFW